LNGLAGLVNGRVDFYVRGMSENGDWLVYEYEPEEPVLVENGKGEHRKRDCRRDFIPYTVRHITDGRAESV
jgi:hypothetical protein